MTEPIDEMIENTRKRVEAMRRLTDETALLLEGTKKAEEELDLPTARIQERQLKARTAP